MSSSSDSEVVFVQQLIEAGRGLLDPPSSVEELLLLLDKAEYYLARVEQSPNKTIEDALSTCTRALVADELFKHSDADIMVAVASCISEITRITAPEAPYSDEEMKEIFRLIISSFEHLDDQSSRSYTRRTSILEILAKVRSCVVLLDLECDALVIEMFQHFLKAIRDHHPERVFSSMETIMTLVLEESEDISPGLLSPILDTLKRDDEGVLPIAKRLGEKVLQNCSTKLKDFLGQAMISLGTCMDDYIEVVRMICQDGTAEDKNCVATPASQLKEMEKAASPKPDLGNGLQQRAEDNSKKDQTSIKPGIVSQRTRLKITGLMSRDTLDNSEAKREAETDLKPKKIGRKRGRKRSALRKSTRSGNASSDGKKQPGQPVENGEDSISNLPSSLPESKSIEADLLADGYAEADVLPSPKETIHTSLDVCSPSENEELKKKEGSNKESEGPNESDAKVNAELGKRSSGASGENRTPIKVRISRKKTEAIDNAKINRVMPSAEKVNLSMANNEVSSPKSLEVKDKKGTAKRKKVLTDTAISSEKKDVDEEKMGPSSKKRKYTRSKDRSVETPKVKEKRKRHTDEDQHGEIPKGEDKRKRTPGKESDAKEYGEDLVGSKVKIWWPKDKAFYEGVVDSFDDVKKKHMILYNDGDIEKLNLRKEKWMIIQDGSGPNKEQEEPEDSRESTPEMPLMEILRMSSKSSKKLSAMKAKGRTSKKPKVVSPTSDNKPHSDSKKNANLEASGGRKADNNTPNIGSKLVGLARRMTSKSKGVSETKKENDETKAEKLKKNPKSNRKGSTGRSVGRPRKPRSDASDKVMSGSSVTKLKDAGVDSGGPSNRDKSSLSKRRLKYNKVDRGSGEDLSGKGRSGLLKRKPKESKEKPSKKLKSEESKEKKSDSREEPSDTIKSSSMEAKQKAGLTQIEMDKDTEKPSDKVKSSSSKPNPDDSEDVKMDSGEVSDKLQVSLLQPKQKPMPKESEKLVEDSTEESSEKKTSLTHTEKLNLKEGVKDDKNSGEEPSEKFKISLTPTEKLNLKECEKDDKNSGEEPSDKVKGDSPKPRTDPEASNVVDQDLGEETVKVNASEEEHHPAESLNASSDKVKVDSPEPKPDLEANEVAAQDGGEQNEKPNASEDVGEQNEKPNASEEGQPSAESLNAPSDGQSTDSGR
ncbi:hypothetical protein SAY87_026108 [Trapa incisa]|uniref:Uncharacterized protein n=1 Tax=Trapa incisa TaxID=236973 RepID=A0AAN7GIS2_9MYRT|nr:hypothetical protein SAY87_026108 [Trapa incisa]